MRFVKLLLLILVCWLGVTTTFPDQALADITTITVEINPSKANGKEWDAWKGVPDLAICLSNQLVGTLCLPDGDRVSGVLNAQCQDSFRCTFSAEIPDGTFKISIVDVDVMSNDLIGTGHCSTGQTCEIGQAKITIKEPKHKS